MPAVGDALLHDGREHEEGRRGSSRAHRPMLKEHEIQVRHIRMSFGTHRSSVEKGRDQLGGLEVREEGHHGVDMEVPAVSGVVVEEGQTHTTHVHVRITRNGRHACANIVSTHTHTQVTGALLCARRTF